MGRRTFLLLTTIFILGIGQWASAEFIPPIKEAVIYPDGLAFLVREGETNLLNGECVMDFLPPALKGSLSLFSTAPGLSVEQVIAFRDPVTREQQVADLGELFQENIEKPVQLMVNGEMVTGIIKGFINPAFLVVTVNNQNGVSTDEVYPIDMISSYFFLKPVELNKKQTEYAGKLKVKFRGTGVQGTYPVGISYLQSGISWSPEYIINLQSENYGEFSFVGVVRNDADDFVATTLSLAERGPQFPRGISPLALFSDDQPVLLERGELSVMGAREESLKLAPRMELDDLSSLIMYKNKNEVTLKKGERLLLPLFRGAVKVEPLYRLELSRSLYMEQVVKGPVWKVYRIYNNSSIPWIEGQVMLMMNNRPLGVGNFPYIAPDQSGEIRVMTEQGIKVEVTETEFERVQGSMIFQGREFCFVRIRGEIELENTKNEEVKVKVTHLLPGEVISTGEEGTVVKKALLQAGPNPSSEITWEIQILPRNLRKLTYTYQTYLPMEEIK
ncbi:MAG TPA: hypothetical protein DEB05_11115 [Firmicutes bacterium]|jgi:hypothetical protein|nr:hypothetical protein [Bacillota bacterium]HBT17490.1 hypothetical protein [Bacillota bacterium]